MEKKIDIEAYNYALPEERIAKFPLKNRDESKLLVFNNGNIKDGQFSDISSLLPKNSMMVFNNTRVIQARLLFEKTTGAKIEIFCLEPHNPDEYAINLSSSGAVSWKCMVKNVKKWKGGELFLTFQIDAKPYQLAAKLLEKRDDHFIIQFSCSPNDITFGELLDNFGKTPIPPYLKRESEESDKERYQTVYSKSKGSVAAPTAGLHFTNNVFDKLKQRNISVNEVTLHVGAGTFKPVKTSDARKHTMHSEYFEVDYALLQQIRNSSTITAVGTTSIRAIESLMVAAYKLITGQNNPFRILQWEAYNIPDSFEKKEALSILTDYLQKSGQEKLIADTQIMIVPGFKFRLIDRLITNFHQPKSTLLLLIAAFCGENWQEIYKHALKNNYRFLSYGDSSLLIP